MCAAWFTTGYVRMDGKCSDQYILGGPCAIGLADEGDRWNVKLDVKDFEGHLDILASRVKMAISRQVLFFCLPQDYHGRLRVIQSVFILGALRLCKASLLVMRSGLVVSFQAVLFGAWVAGWCLYCLVSVS